MGLLLNKSLKLGISCGDMHFTITTTVTELYHPIDVKDLKPKKILSMPSFDISPQAEYPLFRLSFPG